MICKYHFHFAVHDPDPLMTTLSRRKRRSSWESGTSDGSRATKTPRASIDEPSPSSQHHQSLQAPKSRVHSGDLKMRINVSQSKQKKASTTTSSSSNGQQPQNSSSVGTAAKVVRKSGALAQRPSISSVSVSVSAPTIRCGGKLLRSLQRIVIDSGLERTRNLV